MIRRGRNLIICGIASSKTPRNDRYFFLIESIALAGRDFFGTGMPVPYIFGRVNTSGIYIIKG